MREGIITDKVIKTELKWLNNKVQQNQIQKSMTIPRMTYPRLLEYMMKFYNSTSQNGRCNGQHLTFVTGAKSIGKTSFIQQSITKFKTNKNNVMNITHINKNSHYLSQQKQQQYTILHSPQSYEDDLRSSTQLDNKYHLLIQYDCIHQPLVTQNAFINNLQTHIIKNIIQQCNKIQQETLMTVLSPQIICDIVLHYNAPEYIYVYFKDVIYCMLCDTDIIYIEDTNNKKKLQRINNELIGKSVGDIFGIDGYKTVTCTGSQWFRDIIEIIREEYQQGQLQATFRLFLSVFRRIEYEKRPQIYRDSWYETGIETTQFVFEVLNYLCGFGNLNKLIVTNHINRTHKIDKDSNYIQNGNHIDICLILYHIEYLSNFKTLEFKNWFDFLIARLHNHSNLRTHFPIVIQLDNCNNLLQIQRLSKMQPNNPTVIQLQGYFMMWIRHTNLPLIFQQETMKKLHKALGRNISVWNQAIQQLSNGISLSQIISGQAQFIKNKRNRLISKLNKMYLYSHNLPYIDDNTLKYYIINYLELLRKGKGQLRTKKSYYNITLFENQMFVPLYQHNILINHYYHLAIDLVDGTYQFLIPSILSNQYRQNNVIERLKFKLWKLKTRAAKYTFFDVRYFRQMQREAYKSNRFMTRRPDFQVRDYYGLTDQYCVLLFDEYTKNNYHV